MITQTFGEMVFIPGPEPLSEFASPKSLKSRIVISTKPPNESKMDYNKDDDVDGEDTKTDEEDTKLEVQAAPEYMNLIPIPAGKGKRRMYEWLRVDPTMDLRQQNLALVQQLPDRCYALVVKHPLIVVGTADRNIIIYNL
ncbi:protein rae1 [Phtheirospermum japonicum]|uniref:Protein rae1 n=1 Tax=Phtheirospermum japonicum TaxID=374723 RepID=A0A830B8T5_9LAMI|nr:protein rae1 [Phtheirospermum japonicum]